MFDCNVLAYLQKFSEFANSKNVYSRCIELNDTKQSAKLIFSTSIIMYSYLILIGRIFQIKNRAKLVMYEVGGIFFIETEHCRMT